VLAVAVVEQLVVLLVLVVLAVGPMEQQVILLRPMELQIPEVGVEVAAQIPGLHHLELVVMAAPE
jgi:hypothetical protein